MMVTRHIDYETRLMTLKLQPTLYQCELLDTIFFLQASDRIAHFNIEDHIKFIN